MTLNPAHWDVCQGWRGDLIQKSLLGHRDRQGRNIVKKRSFTAIKLLTVLRREEIRPGFQCTRLTRTRLAPDGRLGPAEVWDSFCLSWRGLERVPWLLPGGSQGGRHVYPFWKLWGLDPPSGEKSNLFSAPTASWAKGQWHRYIPATQPDWFSSKERQGSLPLFGDLFLTIRNSYTSHPLSHWTENHFLFQTRFCIFYAWLFVRNKRKQFLSM